MNDKKPTSSFVLPRSKKEAWVAALRSGNYHQGRGHLLDSTGGYCCLGVLCAIEGVSDGDLMGKDWPTSVGVHVNFLVDNSHMLAFERYTLLTEEGDELRLSSLNDNGYHTFPQIADLIEKYLEVTD